MSFFASCFFFENPKHSFFMGISFSWRYEVTYYRNRLLALSSLRSFEEREKDCCVDTCYQRIFFVQVLLLL